MDGQRMDRLTKALARRVSRRQLASGGAGAALLGAAALRVRHASAHQGTPETAEEGHLCAVPFEADVTQGPSAGQEFTGLLVLQIGADGAIDEGALVPLQGSPVEVAGQATGRAISLLFTVADGQYLYGVGVASTPFDQEPCPTVMGGPFVGPMPGDGGDWAVCCCPDATNNFTCPEDLPPCRRCRDMPEQPPEEEYESCAAQCTASGGDFFQCSAQCLQG